MHLYPSVVLGDHADIMFDDTLTQVLPSSVSFWIVSVWGCGEDVGRAEVGTEAFRHDRPAHEFGDCEKFQELVLLRDLCVAGVGSESDGVGRTARCPCGASRM